MLAATSQSPVALLQASEELRCGGLIKYIQYLKENVYNVERFTIISTILFGSSIACKNSDCLLSKLPVPIPQLIWDYSGVRSGPGWNVVKDADFNTSL